MSYHNLTILMLVLSISVFAQPNTEVYLLESDFSGDTPSFENFKNIVNNSGYDNQPSFKSNDLLYFAANNNGQTDIASYRVPSGTRNWYHLGSASSQYSPQSVPGTSDVLAVHLDSLGYQRLFRHRPGNKGFQEAHPNLRVAYFAMQDADSMLATVLSDDGLDLVIVNLKTQQADTILQNAGRSIHRIPKSKFMSYTAKNEAGNFDVYQLDMDSRESFFVTELPIGIQDHIWLDDARLLIGSGSRLYLYDPFTSDQWQEVANLDAYQIKDISRMALSPDQKHLALVALPLKSESELLIDRQLLTFNARDLDGFSKCFTEDVLVSNFPNDTLYAGREKLYSNYEGFYQRESQFNVQIENRISMGNVIIDLERSNVGGTNYKAATIFNTTGTEIKQMTFIRSKNIKADPTMIVDKQLEAYNNRDIDGFMATYTEDIELYIYPEQPLGQGQQLMRNNYAGFFANTPNLHCNIKNRIVLDNYVVDHEQVTINDNTIEAIAIYEVVDDMIAKVTFIYPQQ